jgi:site-specific DNA recombinase
VIIQHTVTRRGDEYTYFFCRNRQQGTCPAPYVNVAVAEQAIERYYTTVSQRQITDALATLTAVDTAYHDPSRTRDPVQVYRSCTDNQRRLLNHALFRQLYLADDRITNHEPWPTTP